jgi:AsmA protein
MAARRPDKVSHTMQPRKLLARLAILSVATVVCLLAAFIIPSLVKNRGVEEAFSGASVIASPRDMLVVAQPVRLSAAPDLVLARGSLYADGNAALGTPISRFVLDSPVFNVNVAGPAILAKPVTVVDETAPLMEQLLNAGYDTLIIRRGQAQISGADGATETLSDIEAEVTGRRKGQLTIRGSFSYRGQRVKFDTALAHLPEKKGAQRWQVKTALKSAFVDATFDGIADATRDLQISGAADFTIPSLRRVARWLSLPVPNAEGLNAAALKGQLTWARNALSLEQAKVTIDGNEGAGALSLNLGADRPLIDGTLAFTAFDLAPYVDGLRPQTFGFERPSTSWTHLDLSFPLVRYVDTDLRISTPRLTFKSFEIGRTAATFTVRSGKLLADVAEMELGAATANLELTADTNEVVPRYALKGKVLNFDAAQSAAALLSGATWSGKGTLTLDLVGTGQVSGEVVRTLSGKAALTMPQGARVPMELKTLKALAKQGPLTGWANILKGQTTLEAVDLRATVSSGVASLDALPPKTASPSLGMSGTINLAEGELDVQLAPGPDALSLSGPIRAPTLKELRSTAPGAKSN